MWIIRYLLNSFLNFTLSPLYFCMLFGRLLKIFAPEYKTPLCTQVRLMVGKYRWFLFLVLRPCTYALVRKSCWFSITKSIRGSMYWHGTGKILSFLYRFLHDALGPIPGIILITLFCNLNICCACVEFPPKIIHIGKLVENMQSIPYVGYQHLMYELSFLSWSMPHLIYVLFVLYEFSSSCYCPYVYLKIWFVYFIQNLIFIGNI